MTFKISQRDQTLMQLKNIINQSLSDIPVNVYLFGSGARKEEKRTSDIDITLESKMEFHWGSFVNELKNLRYLIMWM